MKKESLGPMHTRKIGNNIRTAEMEDRLPYLPIQCGPPQAQSI